ncbi:DEAD/DEAH box helicase family protein [Ottowia sp.]|uniref:type I restriction endonuclease subunit R n=1 Tax=Ottowia sp. TaxID=1898956 RepID=UPI002B520384|nr:DEAD/DEAH box helicase family protein [Ottowia sp.]HRN76764.1 DEAD/DEAH box helicase family protein [Ottowia sp.]HRQ03876.1 DEAD/DEAH box helicase family protein [Ottowia sp.]
MALHTEIQLERDICAHLGAHGWLYSEPGTDGDARSYDTTRALYPPDLIAWLQATQAEAWAALTKLHGAGTEAVVLERLRKALDDRGTLDVLRHGFELVGLKAPLKLAQFKPALAMNAELQARYAANRLRALRQVRTNHDDVIDLVLLLNGVPVATAEIKTDFTQDVNLAIDQYRFDRIPRPKGKASAEPLLDFPRGALVHFAVSNRLVHMATRLRGPATQFLPFNLGDAGGAGNPPYSAGHRTHYLWEQVLQRDSWLDILGRYLIARRDSKKKISAILFPRHHQLDATRKLVQAVLAEGPGQKYLIQHSAGSGKTNSIAWTAHFLSDLHDAHNNKVFSTVLVVSDRNVLDVQLQEAIYDFQRTTGVVATITGNDASKSQQLAEALSGSKKIVVCTIQTFPFALEAVRELAATQGKRFVVIADEAHSSQTGESAAKLKQVLSSEEQQELADGGEISSEDVLAANMAARAGQDAAISYIAFTATPKAKTLELFGRRPDPSQPASNTNLPAAFHVYSMRQAIEEGFILDVLQNYTPYKLAFRLTHEGRDWTDAEVDRGEAVKGLMRWVRLHPYNIARKVAIVVEHFIDNVQPLLGGHAKAMVVTASRQEVVRWKRAMDRYIADNGYRIGTIVAFSGEVPDADNANEPVSEKSASLNPGLKGKDIREAFATADFQLLLVANKFQTGFDQPLLCGMYVEKKLGGIQAVQTLSRLNRAYDGPHGRKDTTYVLDFVNDPDEVLAAFQVYYETAELSDVTDPNLILDLKAKLDASGHYDEFEVDRVVHVELNPNATQAQLIAAIEPVADRLLKKYKAARQRQQAHPERSSEHKEAKDELDALALFKRDLGSYVRVYAFLGQLFDYGNTAIEKRALFFKRLLPLLDFGREREGIDLSKVVLTHHKLKDQGQRGLALKEADGEYRLEPMTAPGGGQVQDKQKALLSEILERVNDLFEGELTDDDKLVYVNSVIKGKLLESEVLAEQARNNTKAQFAASPNFDAELMNAIIAAFEAHQVMSRQALDSERVRAGIKSILLGPAGLYEGLRAG